ncbi:glycoside hydrolase family 16 protein [Geodermatophilus sp. CPCC 205506]|uniref:glycoside hydrolase family 16 protein n=1 Tax=Geodermatophilus sp. CPCC 205506 TaxID=2936596 RepID=UPI003EEC1355
MFRESHRRRRGPLLAAAAGAVALAATGFVVLRDDEVVTARHPSTAPAYDLPGWDLVLAEDFDADAALGEFVDVYPGWAEYDGARDTSRDLGRRESHQGVYNSYVTTTVQDGVVDVRVHTDDGTPQVMALTPPPNEQWANDQLHGRYSVRFRADEVPGYKIAWLLWPSSDDWSEGELDFPEGSLGQEIVGNAHDVTGNPSVNRFSIGTDVTMEDWHTATIEWAPGRVTFLLDDRSWTTTDPEAIPVDPMRWVLQIETELSAEAPPADAEGHVEIDWVAAWRAE